MENEDYASLLFEQAERDSEDEDYSDYPACGSTGDPAHKVGGSKKKESNSCGSKKVPTKTTGDCDGCDCEEAKEEAKDIPISDESASKKEKKMCYKCKEVEAQFKSRQDFMCKNCFESNIDHKFKANLKLKLGLARNEKCLVCVSGGANSLALSQLVSNAINNTSGKKMFFEAELLYINEDILYKNENEAANLLKIQTLADNIKLPLKIIMLSDIYRLENRKEADEKLLSLIDSFKSTGSCQEDIVAFFKSQLYLQYAYENGFNKVMLGQCGQRLASKIFTLFAKGRAGSADNEIQFVDNINAEVLELFFSKSGSEESKVARPASFPKVLTIGRPMKDFLNKEVITYLHSTGGIKYLTERPHYLCEKDAANSKLPGFGNLDHIMENFIDNIQENFVSTTHTILHTSEKLIKKFTPQEKAFQRCPLCFQFRDKIKNVLEIETFDANLTHSLEGLASDVVEKSERNEDTLKLKYLQSDKIKSMDRREMILCFGCRRIVQGRKNTAFSLFESGLLPASIIARAQHIADTIPTEEIL